MHTMNERMGDPLGSQQPQRNYGKDKLYPLGGSLFRRERYTPPLRSGTIAQAPHIPQCVQVEERPEKRERHHGNTNGVRVKTARRSIHTRGGGQRRQSNGYAQSTNSDDRGTKTLQQGENETRPGDHSGGCAKSVWSLRVFRRRRRGMVFARLRHRTAGRIAHAKYANRFCGMAQEPVPSGGAAEFMGELRPSRLPHAVDE